MKLLFFFFIKMILSPLNLMASENEEIIIHYQVRPPYYMIDENTKNLKDGTLFKNLDKVFKNLNVKYEFHEFPAARTHIVIKENKLNVCSGYAILSNIRKNYGIYSVPFYQDKPYIIVTRKDDTRFDKYSTLNEIMLDYSLVMLVKFRFSYGKYVDELLLKNKKYTIDSSRLEDDLGNGLKLTFVENSNMLQQIIMNRADYMIMSENEFSYFKNNSIEMNKNLAFKKVNDIKVGNKRTLFCSKKMDGNLIKKINKLIIKNLGNI
ncbi:hypothetical protein GCL60_15380 [Silvanigrella paludirubra]|uniref:Transporter substrate-binding domain-containing protein n=1 Tax=Silvanigrella paludirubra TaxID=2499159 RepID=A0A6N6VS99_9BACT|nr:transporter substrate-binding domain-containing protein [Silvanigrella paludirubra]KAB8036506.1 hypothetical protein GCL60_15380 [Silvanigrella paludirubra]